MSDNMKGVEREFETGMDEHFKSQSQTSRDLNFTNQKRTYDAYQALDLEAASRSRLQFDQLQNVALQALQNAVSTADMVSKQVIRHTENVSETSNMTGKQAVKHGDLAADAQWNPIQQGIADAIGTRAVTIDDASLKAIGATVAAALADVLTRSK